VVCAAAAPLGGGKGRPQQRAAASSQLQNAPAAQPAPDAAAASAAGAPAAALSGSFNSLSSYEELTFLPEQFQLPPGQLSEVDRTSPEAAEDVFRCPGCTQEACMVRPLVVLALFAAVESAL